MSVFPVYKSYIKQITVITIRIFMIIDCFFNFSIMFLGFFISIYAKYMRIINAGITNINNANI